MSPTCTIMNTVACPAATVFGIPELAEEIFKHVRLHWNKVRMEYVNAHANRTLVHSELATCFEAANMEYQMSWLPLMRIHKPLSLIVYVRHKHYRVADKTCDFNNTWYFEEFDWCNGIERFEEEIRELYDASFVPGHPNPVRSRYNVQMRRLCSDAISCNYCTALDNYPYYHHLLVFYADLNPYGLRRPYCNYTRYDVLQALYAFILQGDNDVAVQPIINQI